LKKPDADNTTEEEEEELLVPKQPPPRKFSKQLRRHFLYNSCAVFEPKKGVLF